MRKFGLKLWSKDFIKNKDFVASAEKALKDGFFDYLELFVFPNTFEDTHQDVWQRFQHIDTIIHAPHSVQNLDISNPDEFVNNQQKLISSQKFADLLDAPFIILHPGRQSGEQFLNESIRQFIAFNDCRLTVENLPGYCSQTKSLLNGVTPNEIKRFIVEANAHFCLDFSHAICGANTYKKDVYEVLQEFCGLQPDMYHLCDGDVASTNDSHLHYGEGNYDLKRLVLQYTAPNAFITMETGHDIPSDVTPWLNDIFYLKKLISA